MRSFCRGDYADYDGMTLDPDTTFYILGLSPNASRLSVRFFCHDTFGDVIRNLEQHYRDISIVSDGRNKLPFIPLWLLLRETASQKSSDKSPIPTPAIPKRCTSRSCFVSAPSAGSLVPRPP